MHTVVETRSYLRAADEAGMSAEEREDVAVTLGANPEAGDVISGTGGLRKLRVRRPGRGKSGGYRVITFFSGPDVPVFLITVFAKGDRDNLTKAERNAFAKATTTLVETYGKRTRP